VKHLTIEDLPLAEALQCAPLSAVRGGFCGTPVPAPVMTLPAFPEMPAIPAIPIPPMPELPGLPEPRLPERPMPCYRAL
jgi:hypothetical protein